MEVIEAIKTRRSIRRHESDNIDDETLEKILDAARWAPSWDNTQCWRFIVVRNESIKAQLAETRARPRSGHSPDGSGTPRVSPAALALTQAPVVIVACAELGKSGCHPEGVFSTDKGDWYMYDVALATQNLMLAAHAMGVGTVIMTAFNAKKAAEILEVPEGFSVLTLIPLGFPSREGKPSSRKELSEFVYHDKFGA